MGAGFGFVLPPSPVSAAPTSVLPNADTIRQGEYLAHMGDCFACHTARGGMPLAGGVPMNTPFGILYSTNITPDRDTGIGRYTLAQFVRAMRDGVDRNGNNLFPAMPYPSYAKISDQDLYALYAYLMHGVRPVYQKNRENRIHWPFSIRQGLSLWKWLFLDDRPYRPDPSRSAEWNRGAYIIQGLGHCGSCHTPRGFGLQEKAMDERGPNGRFYLSGATIDSWYAPSLRNPKALKGVEAFLKTGRNGQAAAFGIMAEVDHFSTQKYSDSDLHAMDVYLKSLIVNPAGSPSGSSPERTNPPRRMASDALFTTPGGLGYVQFCASCHMLDGKGVAKVFPPLAGNPSLLSGNPLSVVHVILSGSRSAVTAEYPKAFAMPNYGGLSNEELAQIVTFVRTAWGNQAPAVSPDEIGRIRSEITPRPSSPGSWSGPRLSGILNDPHREEILYGMRLMIETNTLLPKNVGDALTCSSCHLDAGTVAYASPFVGLSSQFPSYSSRAGKVIDLADRINGCFLRSMNGTALDKQSKAMSAMVAYMNWMNGGFHRHDAIAGRGVGRISKRLVPDFRKGKRIYRQDCASCHGMHGEGLRDAHGSFVFPPLWGPHSFNIGAGIAKTYTAAAFVKNNMPISHGMDTPLGQGGLTDQEAVDVSAYFTHQPRPDFPDKIKDWPHGKKPSDARY